MESNESIVTKMYSFYECSTDADMLTAEDLLGVSPPMNVKMENPATFMDII